MVLLKQKTLQYALRMASSFKKYPCLPSWVVLMIDLFISVFAFTITCLICYQLQGNVLLLFPFLLKLSVHTVMALVFFLLIKPYVGIIRYSNFEDGIRVFGATTCIAMSLFVLDYLLAKMFNYIFLGPIGLFVNFIFTSFFMFSFRMVVKLIYDFAGNGNTSDKKQTSILIFDVSATTVAIAEMIKTTPSSRYQIVGFVSAENKLSDKFILGIPVYSMSDEDSQIIKKKSPKAMLISPMEQGRHEKQAIADYCEKNALTILALPPLANWQDEKFSIDKIKNIQIEDLLGRVPITISTEEIGKDLAGKCVMVTGAAGSIGSEIVRQISRFQPRLLLLCDIAETPLHLLQLEIEEKFPALNFIPLICDVRNYKRMERIFEKHRPSHVYHAAAYKHVPLMESHPCESIHANVLGTRNIADLSVKYQAEVFVMISTDKAVNPTNIMGASKRLAEIYVQSLYKHIKENRKTQNSKIKIITTRFGNVLGSNGSVIPRFKEQIAKGGPVTVTHPDITRYFMTIPEACRLVLEAANMGQGGEIFVFDMGTPIKIVNLAEKMIRLAGFKPYDEIKIKFTGLRPGEKLFEELLAGEEHTKPTHNKKIMIGTVRDNYEYAHVKFRMEQLCIAVEEHQERNLVKIMKELIPEFKSANSVYEELDLKRKELCN
jgi:FlaA1/EpsC-like NDP-sugar epimerase